MSKNITGIYILYFENPDKCYIGQSVHIFRRITEHNRKLLSNSHYNYKLQEKFNICKTLPTVEILQECTISELSSLEELYIKEFDSIKNGYNIVESLSGGSGYTSSRSKYTEEDILNVFFELLNPETCNVDIGKKLDLPTTLVESIAYNKRHIWVSERYPELRKEIDNIIKSKIRFKHSNNINKRNNIQHKLIDPTNREYIFSNIAEFCRLHSLNKGHVCQVLKGNEMQHKGWRNGGSI